MALWKENPTPASAGSSIPASAVSRPSSAGTHRQRSGIGGVAAPSHPQDGGRRRRVGDCGELSIEGKIEGSGNVRMAGRFKGDVRIDGNFTMDTGAHLTGQVLAGIVVVGGELQGNIESAKRVDVLEGGIIVGDVKAGSITVAAGSRMRGHVEFGWEDEKGKIKTGLVSNGS